MKSTSRTLGALFLISALACFAAQRWSRAETVPEERHDIQPATHGVDFMGFPHAYYKPETRLAGGFVFLTLFRSEEFPEDIRPSTIATTFTYTQNKQFIWEFFPDFYLYREKFHLLGGIEYKRKPNKFYGIGNDTPKGLEEDYATDVIRVRAELQRRLISRLYLGLVYHYEWSRVTRVENGKLLESGAINGTMPGAASGMGITMNYDTRNSALSASRGYFFQFMTVYFNEAFDSDYTFVRYTLDLRGFLPLFRKHVLAFQSYTALIDGDAPFEMLSLLGGKNLMRGIFEGRFRDNAMQVLQAEYRSPFIWRIRFVGFAGIGQVAPRVDEFKADGFKFAFGGGVRYGLRMQENVFLRLDVARSEELTALYITVGEAF